MEDRTESGDSSKEDSSLLCPLVSSNGVSDELKTALLSNASTDGDCLAAKIPGDLNWK